MENDKKFHLRHIFLKEFNHGSTAVKLFQRCSEDYFSICESSMFTCTVNLSEEHLIVLSQEDIYETSQKLPKERIYSTHTELSHLNEMGKVQMFGVRIPHIAEGVQTC